MKRILPKRGLFRMRAHANPFSWNHFPFPPHHSYVDWRKHFPLKLGGSKEQNCEIYANTDEYPVDYQLSQDGCLFSRQIHFLDVGCGYGGLLFALAPLFPDKLILGLQIRQKLVNYVGEKIRGYRMLYPNSYDNISVVRTNTMRYLCNYIAKGTVEKIFICFPDPHFKSKAVKRRIINTGFLSEYAYLLQPKGRLYCVTDVEELYNWNKTHLLAHGMFREVDGDECVQLMLTATEQSKKVDRKGGVKYVCVFERTE